MTHSLERITSKGENSTVEPAPARRQMFGIEIDPLTMSQAIARILGWIEQPSLRCRFIVTPNVDHVVMLQSHSGLRDAYRDASLVLADGWPVVAASRWLRQSVPERVAGSDLVPALFSAICASRDQLCWELSDVEKCHEGVFQRAASRHASVYLLGAAPGVAARAAERIERDWQGVRVVGTYSPPLGFENDPSETENILNRIAGAAPDILVVGLGAPKQELWVHAQHEMLHTKVALCVGATIDFLAGEKPRAPRWMRAVGLEWLHRLGSEPKRLARRYLRDAWIFPQLVLRERFGRR